MDDVIHQKAECHNLDELDQRSFTTIFIPGNHENYDRLMSDEFSVTEWHGGRVKQIRPSVLMLMRGEMYDIDGMKVFAFGGASSHDVTDGILDGNAPDWKKTAKELSHQGKRFFRIKGISWWPQELPSEEEMQHGIETLEEHNWKCDYVVTHCAPASILPLLGIPGGDKLNRYLEEIRVKLDYKKWFFGHYHRNVNINMQDILLYEQIIRIR